MADTASGAGAAAASAPAASAQKAQEVPSSGVNKKLAEQMSKVRIAAVATNMELALRPNTPIATHANLHLIYGFLTLQMPEGLFRQVVLFL